MVGISWYEAMAFCVWLDAQMRQQQPELFTGDAVMRLPTEAEWERAACGTGGHRYPWGEEWREDNANTKEADLERTSAVGLFGDTQGHGSPADMIGNCWEWCQSRWGRNSHREPDYGYPYDEHRFRDREQPTGSDLRIVRGGSWYNDKDAARCACRLRDIPDSYLNIIGCRVVLSLAISAS